MTAARDILAEICDVKREHVARRKQETSFADLGARALAASEPRNFAKALADRRAAGEYGFICEIKKASPSKGLIRPDFDPPALARAYEAGGATCLSILTDIPYFQGDDSYLVAARAEVSLPCLRKDFIVDPWQVLESRVLGADCILLIMAALDDGLAREIERTAFDLGMDVLIEVHDRAELDRALKLDSMLIGVNNRNLKTMQVSLETTLELARHVPDDYILIAESGLATPADLAACEAVGAGCFLIGETFMRQDDVAAAVRAMQRPAAA